MRGPTKPADFLLAADRGNPVTDDRHGGSDALLRIDRDDRAAPEHDVGDRGLALLPGQATAIDSAAGARDNRSATIASRRMTCDSRCIDLLSRPAGEFGHPGDVQSPSLADFAALLIAGDVRHKDYRPSKLTRRCASKQQTPCDTGARYHAARRRTRTGVDSRRPSRRAFRVNPVTALREE